MRTIANMEVVRVKDIRSVLEDDSWNENDEIHEYAVCLIEWCIAKRKFEIADNTPIINTTKDNIAK